MLLEMLKTDQHRCVYIAYYLFKNIEKELNALADSLKKETDSQDSFKEFRSLVDKELDTVRSTTFLLREAIDEDGEFRMSEL